MLILCVLGEEEHRAAVGRDADFLESGQEIRRIGHDDEVAGEGEAEADAGCRAAHGGDHGLLDVVEVDDGAFVLLRALASGHDVVTAHRAHVAAGAEGAARAGQNDGAHLVIRVERNAMFGDAVIHLLGQRVQLVRAVE